jgi:AraC-like DNA-binding protein
MMDEVRLNNQLVLKQFKQTVDEEYIEIKALISEIAMNSQLEKILYYNKPITGEQRYNIHKFMDNIYNKYFLSFKSERFYFYLSFIDSIITDSIFMDSKHYYEYYAYQDFDSYEEWLGIMNNKHYNYVINNKGNNNHKVMFIKSLPIFNADKAYGNICIILDLSIIMESVIHSIDQLNGTLAIIDKDNNIVFSTNEYHISKDFYQDKLMDNEDLLIYDNNIISYMTSQNEQWKYLYIIPKDIYAKKTKIIQNKIFFFMIIYLIISSTLVYFIINKNYKPIKQLINSFGRKQKTNVKNQNEFHIIREYINMMDAENKKLDTFINKQKNIFKNEFIRKLLKGQQINYSDQTLRQIDLNFQSDLFAVALIYIDSIGDELKDDYNFHLIQFIITNVFEEVIGIKEQGHILYIDGVLICLINMNSNQDHKDQLIERISEAVNFLDIQFNIELTVAVSNIHKSISNIVMAYEEVLETINYKLIMGDDKILDYNDIMNVNHIEKYYYPIKKERELSNAIQCGHYEEAKKVLNSIFKENFEANTLLPKVAKSLVLELSSTIIKVYKDSNIVNEEELVNEVILFERLLSYDNIIDIKNGILDIIKTYSNRVNNYNNNADKYIKYDIQNYIIKNIDDQDLNISTIAEYFSLHPFYLSKIYKEKNGEGILDTITKIRIKKAKELLQKYTVKEVAKKVGYTNTRTFTRGFKKLEGMTPGVWTKANK